MFDIKLLKGLNYFEGEKLLKKANYEYKNYEKDGDIYNYYFVLIDDGEIVDTICLKEIEGISEEDGDIVILNSYWSGCE
jgi:hypothetical protein